MRNPTARLLRRLDDWLLGRNAHVQERPPYVIVAKRRGANIYRDGRFVAACPSHEEAVRLVDYLRRK